MLIDMGYNENSFILNPNGEKQFVFDKTKLKKGEYKASGAGVDKMFMDLGQEDFLKGLETGDAYSALKITSPVFFEKDLNHPSYPFAIKTIDKSPVGVDIFNKTFKTFGKNQAIEGRSAKIGETETKGFGVTTTTKPSYKFKSDTDLNHVSSKDLTSELGKYKAISKGEPSLHMQKPRQEITSLNINGKDVEVKETQPDVVNGFYSPLEKVIADSKFDKLPVKQWIEKFAKGEEAKWTGLTDWLSSQTGSVSKADIQQYLKNNRVSVVEVEKGEEISEAQIDALLKDEVGQDMTRDEAREYLSNDENTDQTKFSTYQLEGEKENYKEVLVTMPSKKSKNLKRLDELIGKGGIANRTEQEQREFMQLLDETENEVSNTKFQSSHFEEPNILVHLRMNTRKDAQGNKVLFLEEVQSDWGQTGKKQGFKRDINDVENKKINEIKTKQQSILDGLKSYKLFKKLTEGRLDDMSQGHESDKIHTLITVLGQHISGRIDNPYYDKNNPKDVERSTKIILEDLESSLNYWFKENNLKLSNEDKLKLIEAYNEDAKLGVSKTGRDYYKGLDALKEVDNLKSKIYDIEYNATKGNVSDAPFVTDTNAWTKLGLKVALKEAVKQGADKIAWTNGEQQNARYDLSQTIKNIDAKLDRTSTSDNSPVYKITSKYKSGEETSGSYKESELEGVVGKELAEKIINNKGGKYEGVDLQVGGKGMKGFYGSPKEGSLGIVGNVAKSLFKQEPKTVEIKLSDNLNAPFDLTVKDENGKVTTHNFDSKSKASAWLSKEVSNGAKYEVISEKSQEEITSTQHSIDITPELKASVSQGQPLFQKPRKGTDLVEKAGKRKEMTEDDKGNYLFFHYSDAKFKELNPEKVGTHLATSRGESPLVKSSMLYTRPDRLEPNVPSRNGYIVKVAKDKVYDFNSDPLKLLPEAEKLFRKENGKDKSFDLNNQVAYVAKVASKEGYPVTVSDWNIKGTKALRAQTVEKLPVEKYQGVKEGTYNQIETNPKYENIKPNAKRRDIQYSKGEEDLNTIFGNAEATAKSHSIEKGLQELESSDYYKKQPKESQQELTEYFKERAGAEEKGTTIDKFNALDKIAEEFKKGNVTKELRNQKKAIFEENPEIEHIEKNFSKITKQLEENKDFKKSSPECP